MASIKALTQKIEAEQIRKLQELSSHTTSQSAGEFLSFGATPGRASPSVASETDFERLVYGKKDPSSPANDGFEWQAGSPPRRPAGTPTPQTQFGALAASRGHSPAPQFGTIPAVNRGPSPASPATFAWSTPTPAPAFGTLQPAKPTTAPLQPAKPATGGFGSTTAFRPTQTTAVDWSAATKTTFTAPAPAVSVPTLNLGGGGSGAMGQIAGLSFGSSAGNGFGGSNVFGSSTLGGVNGLGGGLGSSNGLAGGLGGSNGFPTSPMTGGVRKGGGIQLTNFGAPPPPPAVKQVQHTQFGGVPAGGFTIGVHHQQQQPPPQQQQAKKAGGLDQWESLL